jgi:hypothetical protein
MPGTFEKNIENQLSNFSLEPSAEIWQEVENALHPRRRDRGVMWWWVPLLGLLLSAGGWWWFTAAKHTTTTKRISVAQTVVQNKKSSGSSVITDKEKQITNLPTTVSAERKLAVNKEAIVSKTISNKNNSVTEVIKEIKETSLSIKDKIQPDANKKVKLSEPATELVIKAEKIEKNTANKPALKNIEPVTANTGNNADTILSTPKNTIISEQQKDSTTVIKTETVQTIDNRHNKEQWLLTAGVGSLNVYQNDLFGSAQQNQYYAVSPSTGGTAANISTTQIAASKNGFNFFAGINYKNNFSKRWILSTGVQYRYLQNKQTVGSDSLTGNATFYSATGNMTTKTNYAHWLQLPLGIDYIINPSAKNKFQLLLGGSLAWAFGEKWLITSKNTSYPFYYNTSLNNRVILNLNAGIGYNFNDHFQISLLAEQSLTPVHKPTTEKYYWQQLSLKISKPIHFSLHKHKPPKT